VYAKSTNFSDVGEINITIWRSYFSFMLGTKSANSELFIPIAIGIGTKQKWKRTSQMVVFILSSSLSHLLLQYLQSGWRYSPAFSPFQLPYILSIAKFMQ